MPGKTITLCAPGQPVTGMRPDQDPASLGASECRELQNFRVRSGALTVRKGSTFLALPPVDGAKYWGSWHGVFEGALATFVAYRVDAETRVYRLDGASFTLISGTVPLPANGPVSFAVIRDTDPENAADLLVIGNGVDLNRVYSTASQSYMGPGVGINRKLDPPTKAVSVAGPKAWWSSNTAVPSTTDGTKVSTATLAGQAAITLEGGQNPDAVIVEATFAAADPEGGTSLDLDGAALLQYGQVNYDPADTDGSLDFFQYVSKVEVYGTIAGASVWRQIQLGPATLVEGTFGIATGAISTRRRIIDATGLQMTGATKLKLTFQASAPVPQDFSFYLAAFAASGDIRGDSLHAFAFAEKPGRGESTPRPCDVSGRNVSDFSVGQYARQGQWPFEDGLYSRFDCTFTMPSAGDADVSAVLYRSEALDDGSSFGPFYRVQTSETGTPGTTYYGFPTTALSAGDTATLTDRSGYPNDSDYEAPDSLYLASPPSGALTAECSRLFAPAEALLWCGNARYPLRFRRLAVVDDSGLQAESAAALSFPGEEARAVRGMGAPTGANGLSPLVLFTDRSCYRVSGSSALELARPQRIGYRGTFSARTIGVEGGTVYWLDPQYRINATDLASTIDLSTQSVKEWTAERAVSPSLDAWDGMVRATLGADTILSYDPATRGFFSDVYRQSIVGTLDQGDRWLGWDDQGNLYRLEDPDATGDGEYEIPVSVAFREVYAPQFGAAFGMGGFGRVGIHASAGGSGEWRIALLEPTFGDSQTETIPGENGGRGVMRWSSSMAVDGISAQVTISGDFRPGVTLRTAVLEVDPSRGPRA